MRFVLLLIISFIFAFAGNAQKYGNEWINFSQQYYKIPIAKEGIHRIDSTTLSNYYDLTTVDPRNFQVFFKGREQHLYIKGEADGKINAGDYLEFYANPLMGDIDSLVYTNIAYMPNPYLSIYNDTLCAFLTVNSSLNNKRFILETDTASALYPTADHYYTTKVFTLNEWYNAVLEHSSSSSDPHLTQSEGKGFFFSKNASYTSSHSGLNIYTANPLPFYVTVNYSGSSLSGSYSPDHQVQIFYHDQSNAPVLLHDSTFFGYAPARKKFTLNAPNVSQTAGLTFSSVAAPSFTNTNGTVMHYLHYYYPHTTDLNYDSKMHLVVDDNSSAQKTFYNFSSFNSGSNPNASLLDLTNGKRISVVVNGTLLRAVIPNGGGSKKLFLASEKDTIVVRKLSKVNGSGSFFNYKTINAARPYVMIYHKTLQNSAMSYKSYRESQAGGNFNVIDVDIETLYEQFSYGVRKHPLSIQNFIKFLKDSLSKEPLYVMIIGKAMGYSYLLQSASEKDNLVPTIGIPSADNLLVASLTATNTNGYYPEIPIGRLAMITNSEVMTYLAKVQKYEEPAALVDWKKQVLHFVGGDDEVLLNQLSGYMTGFEQIIEDSLFGGNVTTVKKNTTAPVQSNISDSLRNVINRGAALINFFGHGSVSGFDQAVDDPETYNNKDKYPFVIANSCYSGDIHVDKERSVSERFVIANQKGSIGFLATTSYGFPWNLDKFTNGFYQALSKTNYDQGVGDLIKETSSKNSNGDILNKLVCLEMTLSGDPAVRISNGLLPDYQIFNNDVSFDLKKYTDSVGIRIKYKNLGKGIRDTLGLKIVRTLANGDTATVLKRLKAAMYMDSLTYYFPIDFNRGIGLNKFSVKVDQYEKITEVSETNNTVGALELFIPGGDVLPVYPYKYAVVPKTQTITLKASTTDPFAPLTTYRLQLDTCDKFTSLLSTTLITSAGGVVEWKVNLPYKDSTVYFWRISRDSISPQKAFIWKESSFQTLGDKRGWGQAQFHQFKNDAYQYVSYNKAQRQFIFFNDKHTLKATSGLFPTLKLNQFTFFFDDILKEEWPSAFNGWNIAVFDTNSGQPNKIYSLNTPNTGVGQYNNCVEYGERYVYSFGSINACGTSSLVWKANLENFLNSIPHNQYILAYTTGAKLFGDTTYSQISSYSNSLYTAFESFGAKNIRTTSDTVPYILYGRKGMSAGQGHVLIGANKKSIITLDDSIQSRWHSGFVASEIIGPSNTWNSLHWKLKSLDNTAGDTTLLKVVGIKANGQVDTLVTFNQDSSDVMALSAYADASVYPYLKLVAFMSDDVYRTSPQLSRWQVLYDEAPECAINPLKGFASINDTLQEGDAVSFRFPIENIGAKNFKDSLVITYWIENKDRTKIPLPHKLKAAPFAAGQILIDTVTINTYQYKGDNALWIYVNPITDSKYQYEQSQFNNIGRYPFKVNSDITNPLLDVTFDGVRILNGDIVSAKPNILITLKDENKYLALNDTSAFTIYLQSPDQSLQQRIYFGEQLTFTPANLPKNSCSINYSPTFGVDGKYTLIVQAKDRSANTSAARDYRIQFEVNNHPTVTQVLNYPNPFSTSTRFVFTLTGSEVPEVFTIQIMTITGKIVREITRAELGNIHIGRNITDYAWDGRDNYGDRLANGVYLYKVNTKLNGQNIERNASGADKFFVKEFGKMVLMR
ncbi:hypothetical protein CNR22_20605 [Sphingobacteriaceae bacterium]|nr:hypothetical protein CNR22_20605 [Sphingobacteriaceae bacterium]